MAYPNIIVPYFFIGKKKIIFDYGEETPMRNIYDRIVHAVLGGNTDTVRAQVEEALTRGFNVMDILNHGLLRAMHIVGDRFERNEIYVTELLISARGVQEGISVIRPYLMEDDEFIKAVEKYPKLFTGFSDTTINHFMCYKLGLSTYYGPNFIYSRVCKFILRGG